MQKQVAIYLKNRAEFYDELLRRLPHEQMREHVRGAMGSIAMEEALLAAVTALPEVVAVDSFLATLTLKDALKKPAYGLNLAKTTISWEEALERCEGLEETGIILFDELCRAGLDSTGEWAAQAARRREALAAILKIGDDFRYHRTNLLND